MKVIGSSVSPKIKGLNKGDIVLFFFRIGPPEEGRYCLVFGQRDKCVPKDGTPLELSNAKVAVGTKGEPMTVSSVRHGQKYHLGGFVEMEDGFQVGWHPEEENYIFGVQQVPRGRVIIAI